MDTPTVEIVGYEAGLIESAARLRSRVFGLPTELNHRYLTWKYLENPYISDPLLLFAVSLDEVVGMYGSMGTCWEHGGRRYVLGHGGDVAVDPRFRRQGIARQLQHAYISELDARGLPIAFSLSGGRMGTPTMVAGGWHVVAMLDELVCSRRRWVTAGRRVMGRMRRRLRPILGVSNPTNPLAGLAGADDGSVEVLETTAWQRFADIASLAPPSAALRHVRDREYFRWRLANPLSHYRALASPDAYLIFQWDPLQTHVSLVDWRARNDAAFSAVFRVALQQIQSLRVWTAALDAELLTTLERIGSVRPLTEPSASFTMRAVADGEPHMDGLALTDLASWDLRMIDSDEY